MLKKIIVLCLLFTAILTYVWWVIWIKAVDKNKLLK